MSKLNDVLKVFGFSVLIMLASCSPQENFVNALNKEYGANKVKLVKEQTTRAGYIIVEQDGKNYAFKYSRYYFWGISSRNTHLEYYLKSRYQVTDVGNGVFRGPLGWLYEENNVNPKDLEKIGSLVEEISKTNMANHLSEKFGLSEDRSYEVAGLLRNWYKVQNNRTMTENDQNAFMKKTLGIDVKELNYATEELKNGNANSFDHIIEKAANVNGLGFEDVKRIIDLNLLK